MAILGLGSGFQNGLRWTVDLDNTSGNIGVTVTGTISRAGTLFLNAQITNAAGTVLGTIAPIDISAFAGLGRQVLYSNAGLIGITQPLPYGLKLWTTFQPS